MPSLWYQAGLHCNDQSPECPYDVSGWTMAGLPGVFIGHNNRIAWGFTNLGPDVTDLVLEQIDGDSYIVDGIPMPLETTTETIRIAGGQERTIEVRSTARGPIVSDTTADPNLPRGAVPSRRSPHQGWNHPPASPSAAKATPWRCAGPRWIPSPVFDAVHLVNTAQDWEQFRQGAQLLSVPAQNLVYADVNGNIGYQAPGRHPAPLELQRSLAGARLGQQVRMGRATSRSTSLPRPFNPAAGWITTANTGRRRTRLPYPVQSEVYSYGARAQRINERIESLVEGGSPLTAADMASIQMDAGNDIAEFLVPRVRDIPVAGLASEAGQLFEGWDYQQPIDSAPGAYFNVFYRQLIDRLFNDELGGTTAEANANDRFWEVIRQLWDTPNNAWWDDTRTVEVESRDDTIAASLEAAAAELEEAQGGDPQSWNWGRLHTLTFANQTLGDSDIAHRGDVAQSRPGGHRRRGLDPAGHGMGPQRGVRGDVGAVHEAGRRLG